MFLIVFTLYSSDTIPKGMVLVEGGTFQMGTDKSESDEEPIHNVTLDDFCIGTYEVTQKEWEAVMEDNPSLYKGDDLPVHGVDWYHAVEYCIKKSINDGLTPCYKGSGDNITCDFKANGYRLPTEAEWEFACRGGLKSKNYVYSGSNNPDEVSWHEINSEDKIQPVGLKKPNELGIYDMSGNIWEWCWDWYDEDYYKTSPTKNPHCEIKSDKRCYRGGGGPGGQIIWLRSTARYNLQPTYNSFDMGLRVVKNISGKIPANMTIVKGGTFPMGNNVGANGEEPAHTVTLDSFYIGKYEVTQEEWCAVMKSNPSYWVGTKLPVDSITWFLAVKFCNIRSKAENLTPCYTIDGERVTCNFEAIGYRLPTEAEWEFACRGGNASKNFKYSGSNDASEVAWYRGHATFKTEPVGQKKPNELGIYDMNGNVWEWCWDWYNWEYYKSSETQNPKGPKWDIRRCIRGGSIYASEDALYHYDRTSLKPFMATQHFGMRVVRSIK